jgi:hypothetical protein
MSSSISTCPRCGLSRVITARLSSGLCRDCWNVTRTETRSRDSDDILRGGRWVSKHGIQVWEPDPVPEGATPLQADVEALTRMIRRVTLEAHAAQRLRALSRTCCDECGCLILPDEACPGCAAAADKDAAAA